jgi:hypothetical protein
MARRKGFGNPLSKTLGKVLDEVAPKVLDTTMDIAGGPSKGTSPSASSPARGTDWATRVPAPPRKRH